MPKTRSSSGTSGKGFEDELLAKTGQFLQKVSDNYFSTAGIKFIRIEPEHSELVVQFLNSNFLSYDLISTSFDVTEDKVLNSKVEDSIKDGISVMATDQRGDIVGVILASLYKRGDWLKKVGSSISISAALDFSNASKAREVHTKLAKLIGYDVWTIFEGQDCQAVAGDLLLCTSKESPVIGLGWELVKQGDMAAKEKGCDLAVCMTTDKHTQGILRDSGYTLRSVVVLCDFKDEKGNLYLKNVDEDSSARFLCKNLKLHGMFGN